MSDNLVLTPEQRLLAHVVVKLVHDIPVPDSGSHIDHEAAATAVVDLADRAVRGHWEWAGIPVRQPVERYSVTWADVEYLSDDQVFNQTPLHAAVRGLEDALGAPPDAPIAAEVGTDILLVGYLAHVYASRVFWTISLRHLCQEGSGSGIAG